MGELLSELLGDLVGELLNELLSDIDGEFLSELLDELLGELLGEHLGPRPPGALTRSLLVGEPRDLRLQGRGVVEEGRSGGNGCLDDGRLRLLFLLRRRNRR